MKHTMVLLGGTSDLAQKKIFPALYNLYKKEKLDIRIIGTSRNDLDDKKFREVCLKGIKGDDEFRKRITFQRMAFSDDGNYTELKGKLEKMGGKRIFYLSTLPEHFETITEKLAEHELVEESSKILYEKPFGTDLESSHNLNKLIKDKFSEGQIYRIDHYLNKELVQNISFLRFANTMMEPVWNSDCIDHIQIILSEDFGVEGRGEFYDKQGAIKDVFQSHILQLLALIAMDAPKKYDSQCIRDEKVKVLKNIKVDECITGQYKGYAELDEVADDSQTETFTAVKMCIKNRKWKEIPVYALTGKKLEKKEALVYIEFKKTQSKIFEEILDLEPNSLIISIQPEEEIYFMINTKVPGDTKTTASKMDFCYSCQHGKDTPEAYENLILDMVKGIQHYFVRYDEIEEEWKVTEKIKKPKPFTYKPGKIPKEAIDFIEKDGREWHI